MRRREFIAALGGAAVRPIAARAQQLETPTVGGLINGSPRDTELLIAPFRDGLRDLGYIEGQNVAIEYRWTEDHYERLSALAAELIDLRVAVIAALNGASSALAVKALTNSIPIVFETEGDAAELGFVANLNRPEGNLTGVSGITTFLVALQCGLLRELFPKATSFALLTNPASPTTKRLVQTTQAVAKGMRRELILATAGNEGELDSAFATLAERRPGGVVIPTNAFFLGARHRIVLLAANYKIAAIYDGREFAEAGGLISYGQNSDRFRQVGFYVGKILRGAQPVDLPVVQPSKLELVINLKAAKALGLTLPQTLVVQADKVIE